MATPTLSAGLPPTGAPARSPSWIDRLCAGGSYYPRALSSFTIGPTLIELALAAIVAHGSGANSSAVGGAGRVG